MPSSIWWGHEMIEFMVIAAPRSGTTWAANWLTTNDTLCLHDPLHTRHYNDLDLIKSDKHLGISCTGIRMFGEFLAKHPARKVILHRDPTEINASLSEIGLPEIDGEKVSTMLQSIKGLHFQWTDLFSERQAELIHEFLLEKPFDTERHQVLMAMSIEPAYERVPYDKAVMRELLKELHS